MISQSSLKIVEKYDSQIVKQSPQQPQVKIYLRRTNNQAIAVYVPKILSAKGIFQLASKYFSIPEQFLMIMYRGEKIYHTNQGQSTQLVLSNNDILHIHQTGHEDSKSMVVHFKAYDCEDFENGKSISLEMECNQVIGQTVSQFFNISKYSFVQSGRKLDLSKTFQEQNVQNESTIIVTIFHHPFDSSLPKVVIRKRAKGIIQIEDDSNVQMDIDSFSPRIRLRKTVSWSSPQSNKLQSFKKKKKTSAYKPMKSKDGKQVVWQSDSSTQHNKQNVARKLALRKHKNGNHKSNNSQIVVERGTKSVSSQECQIIFSDEEDLNKFQSSKPIFSIQDKMDLKNQLKKILFPNAFSIESDVQKLQPPEIIIDNFTEEVQQIQIAPKGGEVIQNKSSSPFENIQASKPLNLRQSIGKSKGLFLPLISTDRMAHLEKDDDEDDDDDEQAQKQQ